MKIPTLKEIELYIQEHPLTVGMIAWAKRRSFPGFFKVPLWDVLVFLYNETQRDDLIVRANAVSFSLFLSIFPTLIALFTLFPLFYIFGLQYVPGMENFDLVLEMEIKRIIPGNAGDVIVNFIEDITSHPRFTLLSFGFIFAIYFASNGMLALLRGFEKTYTSTFRRRSLIRKRGVAVGLLFLVTILLVFSIVFLILGNLIIESVVSWLYLDWTTAGLIHVTRWVVIISVVYIAISSIYRYGAAMIHRFRWFSPGASLATIVSILTSVIFSFYVDQFNLYNKLYGSIGTIIASMLWLQLNVLIILIGFELNASIAINRDLKKQLTDTEEVIVIVKKEEGA
ncbi:MAG: YihY/virulence factor BrkB family protein [Saprospiraceae bacterium]